MFMDTKMISAGLRGMVGDHVLQNILNQTAAATWL